MEELLRPGVSSARDVPSPELRLHARARTSTVALSSLGRVVILVPGSRSGLVRGNLGLAQLGSRCRKLKRQEKEGQVEKRQGKKEREGERLMRRAAAPDRPGLPVLALSPAAQNSGLSAVARGWRMT